MNIWRKGVFDGELAVGCVIGLMAISLMTFIAGLGLGLVLR